MSTSPNLPSRITGNDVPGRVLTTEQFEMVIRRAAELQASAADEASGEGISEAEVVRIGRELGLSSAHLNRALGEIRGAAGAPQGVLDRAYGAASLQAGRTVVGDVESVKWRLESYLLQREYMTVLRRFPDRTLYQQGKGVVASLGRAAGHLTGQTPMLNVTTLEVAVQPLEDGFCYVTVSTSLTGPRTGFVAGTLVAGGGGASAAAVALAIMISPVAALGAVPIAGGAYLAMRWGYRSMAEATQLQLEALLDRLEHGELPPPRSAPRQR